MTAVARWFDTSARDLPWRANPEPWAVLVSEVMLQQTPVSRVLPVFDQWMKRWPAPRHLADDVPGEAVRMWGRLGYPTACAPAARIGIGVRRAVRRRGSSDVADLRSLPGVGEYTAAAVAVVRLWTALRSARHKRPPGSRAMARRHRTSSHFVVT